MTQERAITDTVLAHFRIISREQHFDVDCVKHRNGGKSLSAKAKRNYQSIYNSLTHEERRAAL